MDAAGSYELLLEDSSGALGDGAHYRGKLIVTLIKTGTVPGRLFYNEAPRLEGTSAGLSPDWGVRAYTPVVRSFAAPWTVDSENALESTCPPRLGLRLAANRQSLVLRMDFSASPLELKAEVRDPPRCRPGRAPPALARQPRAS